MPAVHQPDEAERLFLLRQKMARLGILEARDNYENDFRAFLEGAWSSIDSAPYQQSWSIDAFADHLEATTLGYIKRLLANYPPRCAKTTVASIAWPAWIWARSQDTFISGASVKLLTSSYGARLSLEHANKTRQLILSPWYQKYWGDRFTLRLDQNTKSHMENTKGGARQATSVGGSLLGLGGAVLVVDDAHNTETEKKIETDVDRKKVAGWWRELHSTRLNDPKKSVIVVVMQRLHTSDLSGIILDSDEDWCHLCIPMRFDERRRSVTVVLPQYDDPEPWADPRTEDGELMWPERFGEIEVRKLEKQLGPYLAAGRLQQMPVPKGGGIIKRDWWQLWGKEEAACYGLEWISDTKEFPHFALVFGSLDTSYGEKDENNYNAMTVWGVWLDRNKNRRLMMMYGWVKRLPLHGRVITQKIGEAKVNFKQRQQAEWGLVELVADTCKRYKIQRLLIENKTRGHDVANEIARLYARDNWGVEMVEPVGDKVSRTHSVVPLFTDGMIWAPETRWSDEIITNVEIFPKGEFDDAHDSVTQAINWAREKGIVERADETNAALEDEMRYKGPQQSVANAYGVG